MNEYLSIEHSKSTLEIFSNLRNSDRFDCDDIRKHITYNKNFIKTAHPDKVMMESGHETKYLNDPSLKFNRGKMLGKLMWTRNYDESNCMVVYDLDAFVNGKINCDLEEQQQQCNDVNHLHFESRFEGGNLRKAIKMNDFEYNLFMTPDVNCTSQRQQWFYFEVRNMQKDNVYTFHIVNFDKLNSQFNNSMQPVFYSVKSIANDANSTETGWMRKGTNIAYYCNNYQEHEKHTSYKTLTFSIDFPYDDDICYIAYHYPYTYTRLMTRLYTYENKIQDNVYMRCDSLCRSIAGNEVPLVTITSNEISTIKERPLILLTGRVHPGEPNASWIMEGILDFLTSDDDIAIGLRDKYVFKIVPMLNVDGVMYGK